MKAITIIEVHSNDSHARQLRHAIEDALDLIRQDEDTYTRMQPATYNDMSVIEQEFHVATSQLDDVTGIAFKEVTPQNSVMDYTVGTQLYNAMRNLVAWLHWEHANDTWILQPATMRSINLIDYALVRAVKGNDA